jgi:O-antigen ligase
MLIVVPFMYFTFCESTRIKTKLLMLVGFGIIGYAIFLTVSRGTILSLGVVMVLLFARKYGKVAIALGFVALGAMYVVGSGHLMNLSVQEASSFGRVESWTIGFNLFRSRPLFGVGMDLFTDFHTHTAHNSFILCAAELGLFGLFPWLMLFVISMRNARFVANQNFEPSTKELILYANSILYGLVAFAAAGFFLSRTYLELLFILFGLSVSVSNMFITRSESNYRLWEKVDIKYTVAIMTGLFIVTYLFLRFAWAIH